MEHITSGSTPRQEHHQQQFCLRWHNHQTSLLSSLPILLDQCHLTDVTLSAEGRTLRAHRVVLSACSTFFLELFRALDSSNHPVIIIPGASFAAIVALLTFMYSGEVNVFEEQIPSLLNLAETLGIKGLADVQSNMQHTNSTKKPVDHTIPPAHQLHPTGNNTQKDEDIHISLPAHGVPTPASPLLSSKIPTPLENFFLKSLQFYPNLIPQPLNFSQSALNKTSEFLAKYQQQCSLYHSGKDSDNIISTINHPLNEDMGHNKRLCSGEKRPKDIKRIDKIVENLRSATQSAKTGENSAAHTSKNYSDLSNKSSSPLTAISPSLTTKAMMNFPIVGGSMSAVKNESGSPQKEDQEKLGDKPPDLTETAGLSRLIINANASSGSVQDNVKVEKTTSSPQPKISNSKLYATCFICHKQLSNQYNLRVHLETHQNVRYACNVCSHVSRSKDALRKHVSYRHPGAPSPCESEARRKRAKAMNTAFPPPTTSDQDQMPTSLNPTFMFMPSQFHLGATSSTQMASLAQSATRSSAAGPDRENSVPRKDSTTSTTSPTMHHDNSTTFQPDNAANTKP